MLHPRGSGSGVASQPRRTCPLTVPRASRYIHFMAQTFLLFDFGSEEEAAQRARRAVEGWRQGFRLDKKLLLKFEREQGQETDSEKARIRLLVRLDFSDYEKLSHQRWIERIPGEALFKDAHPRVIRPGDAEFAATAERFEGLD